MDNMSNFLDTVLDKDESKKFKVRIALDVRTSGGIKSISVNSWLSQEFNISLSSSSAEIVDTAMLNKINQYQGLGKIIGEKLNKENVNNWATDALKKIGDNILFNKTVSKLTWSSSSRLNFTLPLIFISYKFGDDVRDQVLRLTSAVLPEESSDATFRAPVGFDSKTSIMVDIGTYMTVKDVIINSVDTVFSKQLLEAGQPAFAVCTVSFSTKTAITQADFRGFLKR